MTKPDLFSVCKMEDCIHKVGSTIFVTKLDLLKCALCKNIKFKTQNTQKMLQKPHQKWEKAVL